jgi:predicted  nucleic acid-binding Zn-ribbon protein
MTACCPKCGNVYQEANEVLYPPCPRCGSHGPYCNVRKIEDMEESVEEIYHPKIGYSGH